MAISSAVGCHSVGKSGYPLYPPSAVPPAPSQIATLEGPINMVDGVNVAAKGRTFQLLPGCHIVTLERNIGEGGENGYFAANLPHITYAFEMKPGHLYKISVDIQAGSAMMGRMHLEARETAPDGSSVRWGRARGDSDLEDCRHWATAAGL
ncbi:MAG TPA: hypothetical protein VFG23_00620 [Polyangia bacterium]|nr:hypothetical protein [Polyangia bacterium]